MCRAMCGIALCGALKCYTVTSLASLCMYANSFTQLSLYNFSPLEFCRPFARWTCRMTRTCPVRALRPQSKFLRRRRRRPGAPAATRSRRRGARASPTASRAGPAHPATAARARAAARPATPARPVRQHVGYVRVSHATWRCVRRGRPGRCSGPNAQSRGRHPQARGAAQPARWRGELGSLQGRRGFTGCWLMGALPAMPARPVR